MRYAAIAVVAAIAYVVLGLAVSHRPPGAFDLAGRALYGEAPDLAVVFTASCWWESLVTLAVLMMVVAWRASAWRARVIYAVIVTLATWQLSNALKDVFRRARPEPWLRIHETSFSYSSGHAMFALVVWWLWAYFVWKSRFPDALRYGGAGLLALWGCGVIWSRLALGAHWPTDLIGGVLLGTTTLALGALVRQALEQRRTEVAAL